MKPGKPKLRQSTLNFSSKTGSLSYSVKSPKEPLANNSSSNSSFCLASQLSSNNSSLSFDESQNGGLNNIQMSPGQRRLNDLKGVWIIKQIDQYKEKLNDPAVSSEEKIDIVLRLLDKSPSTEMIQSSGIGTIIKNIAKKTSLLRQVVLRAFWPRQGLWTIKASQSEFYKDCFFGS